MKVTLHHLITVEEEAFIPDKCPKCEVTFLGKGALKVWEYQDQSRFAEVDLDGDFEWPDLPKGGDNSLYQSWACGECGHMLAESDTAGFHLKLGHPRPPLEVLKILKSKYANNGLPEYANSPRDRFASRYAWAAEEYFKKLKESKEHGD
jgi:phage FluMu protein Com